MYMMALNQIYSIMSNQKNRKIPDEVRDVMRLHHHSVHTEQIKQFICFQVKVET